MAQFYCKHGELWNIYSTISEGFQFHPSLSVHDMISHVKDMDGTNGLVELAQAFERINQTGTNCRRDTLESLLICNRAGEDEKRLTYLECIEKFFSE